MNVNTNRDTSRETQIMEMYVDGMTQSEIASKLKMCRKGVAIVTNRQLDREIQENKKKCICCKEEKELTNFKWIPDQKRPGGKWYYRECLKCAYVKIIKSAEYETNKVRFFRLKLDGVKKRCKEKGIRYDLTPEYCIELYEGQDKKCFYTDEKLILLIKKDNHRAKGHISFDRVDPTRGYEKGNVVLCQNRVNTIKSDCSLEEMKAWMPGWYKRIMECKWINS